MKLETYIHNTITSLLPVAFNDRSYNKMSRIADWHNRRTDAQIYACNHCSDLCDAEDVGYYYCGDWICDDCYSAHYCTCESCDSVTHTRDAFITRSRVTICDGCYESDYFTCDGCDGVFHNDDCVGDGYCESCYTPDDDEDEDNMDIPGYHNTRRPWRYLYSKSPLLGVELEILAHDQEVRLEILESAVASGFLGERDGSLDSERGIEIIAPPLTLEENKAKWLTFLANIRGKARGWDAGTGYGMHVSLNRRSMSHLTTGKILVFIHHNRRLCEKVAGRQEVHWSRYVAKQIRQGRESQSDKYEAVAIRSEDRLEIRIFRSTLAPHGFLRNLEFAAAVQDFCTLASMGSLMETAFREWLDHPQQRAVYPSLWRHLNKERAAELDFKKNFHASCESAGA